MTGADAVARLLHPRSVAVVGASADPGKTAGRTVAYLQKHGFTGPLYPVNPRVESIAGLRCYPDIRSLPETPDVGIVLLGVERAKDAVRELAARGTSAAIVLASGYAETGAAGSVRQRELLEAAGTMRLLGPNTIGLVNLTEHITLSASGALEMENFPAGRIGIVSQSGGILGSLLSRAAARGIGLSKLVSTGNEADLELADFIDHLAGDAATRVIALYVEGVRNVTTFRAACLKAARAGKPVVVYKVGRSEPGARAAVSHTGALAGADRMYDALFKQVGVIRAQTFADLLDIPAALAAERKARGKRVAILTSTGGAATLVADSLGLAGFQLPAPDAATAARLRALQGGDLVALDRNPIDVTLAGLRPDLLRNAVGILLASDTYDALVVIVGSSGMALPELMANALRDSLATSAKPVLAYVSPHAPEATSTLNLRGIPAFNAPESCSVALAAMVASAQWREPAVAEIEDNVAAPLDNLPRGALNEAEAKQLFARFGIPSVREAVVLTPEEAVAAATQFGGRIALKILSRTITHKSDVGGVAANVDAARAGERLLAMAAQVQSRTGRAPEAYVVQEMVAGTELILGFHRDPLGGAILLGMGGVTAELFNDTTLRLLADGRGLSRDEALTMVRELKSWPLLDGYRGAPRGDVEALVAAIVAFSRMAVQLADRLIEAEINPLFVLPAGQGVRAADGIMVLA